MSDYTAIGDELKTILETITDFKIVYAYEAKELNKYPCATVTALAHTDEFIDTHHNTRLYSFAIRLYYRNDESANAERVLRALADEVITTVEGNVTLNNVVDWANPTSAIWTFAEREVPVRVAEITVEAQKRYLR